MRPDAGLDGQGGRVPRVRRRQLDVQFGQRRLRPEQLPDGCVVCCNRLFRVDPRPLMDWTDVGSFRRLQRRPADPGRRHQHHHPRIESVQQLFG